MTQPLEYINIKITRFKCKNTGKYFNVKTETPFAKTKLPFRYWVYTIFLFCSHKRGVSSYQLVRDLGITQKTAGKMLQTLRQLMANTCEDELRGEVEVYETFVGGKNKNRHKDKKVEKCQGRSYKDKTPIFDMLERNGNVIATLVPNTQAKTLIPIIKKYVKKGSIVYTDGWDYNGLSPDYIQMSVDHEKNFFSITYITYDGEVQMISTNGIENFWSHFKRMIIGTYYHVNPKHLQKYVDEIIFRFNTRKITDSPRFDLLLQNIS